MIEIKQVESPNHYSRNGNKIEAVVLHIMQGSLAGCDSWFQNPASQVSAHYGVGRNGEVHQYVEEGRASWHCGKVNRPDLSLPWYDPNINPNLRTLGFEFEGWSGQPLTEIQTAAGIALLRWVLRRYPIEPNGNTVIGHYRLDSVNRAGCPGSVFPWARIFKALEIVDDMDTVKLTGALNRLWDIRQAFEAGSKSSPEFAALSKKMFDSIVQIKQATGLE